MSYVGVQKFIALVGVHFPRAKHGGDEAAEALWLRSMNEILGDYEDDVLIEAAVWIVKNRDPDKDGTMFPKPKHCIDACNRARDTIRIRSTPMLETRERVQERIDAAAKWAPDRIDLAKSLTRAFPDIRRAKAEGWIDAVFHFCREHGRHPSKSEIPEIIAGHKKFRELIADLGLRDDALGRGLLTLGRLVEQRTTDMIGEAE